jgi:hypothetical protein
MPGMAAQDSFYGQNKSIFGAMFFESILGVVGAGRIKPTLITDKGRQSISIKLNQK